MFDKILKLLTVPVLVWYGYIAFQYLSFFKEPTYSNARFEILKPQKFSPYISIFDKNIGYFYVFHNDGHWSVLSPFLSEKGDLRFDKVSGLIPVLEAEATQNK